MLKICIKKSLYDELCESLGIEKSSNRTEKIRKLVKVRSKKGKYYDAYRWVKIMSGNAARIDEHYIKAESDAKVKFNQKHIVSKDFRDLTPEEVKEFVNMAKNEYYYYNKNGVHIAYGNELAKDRLKFNKELSDCEILVNSGSEVYWLPESYSYSEEEHKNKKHGDTITNNIPLEMKDTDKNVKGNYKEAIQQGIDVFIRVTKPMTTEYAITSIEKYIRALHKSKNRDDRTKNLTGKLYLYFERTKQLRLFKFNKSGWWKEEHV